MLHYGEPMPARSSALFVPVPAQPVAGETGERVQSHNGHELLLRSIQPDDEDAIKRCFARLSPQDIRRRFLHAMAALPEPMAQRLCSIDPAIETALVLVDHAVRPAEIRGAGRIYVDHVATSAEFSVLVEHDWARLGLGALLMQRLVEDSRRRGLVELWGYVLLENRPMLSLCRTLGFVQRSLLDEPGVAQIALPL